MESILKRFIFSFVTNAVRALVSFITVILVAKWLGPEDYGRMAFLLSTFIAIKSLLDMGSSSAFFTFLSKKRMSSAFILYFWLWVLLQLLISILIVGYVLPDNVISSIWKGESRSLVFLALIAAFMQFSVWPIASQMAEANRQTIKVQKLNLLIVFLHLLVIVCFIYFGVISIPIIFVVTACEWLIASIIASHYYKRIDFQKNNKNINELSNLETFKSFIIYCLPFIPYVWLAFASDFGDRWILQTFGGSIEQAYYSIALQFASVSLIATTSIIKILWKEVAELNEEANKVFIGKICRSSFIAIYLFTAVICCMLVPHAESIIKLLLGPEYVNGSMALTLMFLYPVHQSLGQLGGSVLCSMGLTQIHVIIGSFHCILSLILAYFLIAPKEAHLPGFDLGSVGLAIKMLSVQFLTVNIALLYISRKLLIPSFLKIQIFILIILIPLSYFTKYFIKIIIKTFQIYNNTEYFELFFSVISYCGILFIIAYCLYAIDYYEIKSKIKYFLKN